METQSSISRHIYSEIPTLSSASGNSVSDIALIAEKPETDRLRLKKKTLQSVIEQCQRALDLIGDNRHDGCDTGEIISERLDRDEEGQDRNGPSSVRGDVETYELCNLVKYHVESPDFLEKLKNAQLSFPNQLDEQWNSWDMIDKSDVWVEESSNDDSNEYVIVRKEDIMDSIASFMATYLLSLGDAKVLSPRQLQDALRRTFSTERKKGKLRKAWDGSKVVYNIASWGASAVGIYQNPVILKVASTAFWASCDAVSKLL